MPPNQHWYCALGTAMAWATCMCSTLFILSMTFDRFYSIIRPHKAASRNTAKRAWVTIVFIVIFSILFNIPSMYTITHNGRTCLPDLRGILKEFFWWLCYVVQFVIPFVSLLTMNCVIIHTLRVRSNQNLRFQGQSQGQGHNTKVKFIDKQVYVILLLVAFSFFIFVTPLYAFNLYSMLVDYTKTPKTFAGFYLFYNVVHKIYFTNNGINFFLYVMSGQKFRTDLVNLFRCLKQKSSRNNYSHNTGDSSTKLSTIETQVIS